MNDRVEEAQSVVEDRKEKEMGMRVVAGDVEPGTGVDQLAVPVHIKTPQNSDLPEAIS